MRFLLDLFPAGVGFLEGGGPVLEKLLLPPVEDRRLQVVFVTQIGDRNPVNQVALENENLLLSRVIFSFLSHGEFLRSRSLTQTSGFSNSR